MNNNSTTHTRFGALIFCLLLTLCAHAQAPYCLPTYDRDCGSGDGFGTFVSQFTFKRGATTLISDATGCSLPNGYNLFTISTPSVSGGSTYAFDIAFARPDDGGGADVPIDAGYAIWIDLNNNNTFENTEIVASGLVAGSGTITIPNGTSLGNHRMRIRSNRISSFGFPAPALPTDPCALQDMGDTHDYTLNVISCPTITDSTTIRLNVTCVAGDNGQFQFVGKGGTAPYTFTLGKITGDETNTTGLFTNLAAKEYRLTITDANGCTGSSIQKIESYTDLSALNNSMLTYDWKADSIATVGTGVQYTYLDDLMSGMPSAAFRITGDSLAKYNQGNLNTMSKYINIGFPFRMDNFYYDSLVISEDGIVSFNRNINTTDVTSQWYNNETYTGLNTYTSPNVGDCQCDTAFLNNPLPFIAPFRDDMQTNASGNVASKIQYLLRGTAPNRIFTVEWRNMRWNRVCNVQRDNSVSFQMELHEGTNVVRFRYKPEVNLKLNNCGGDFMGDFSSVVGYNYSAGLFGRRLGGGNYIAVNPDSTKLFTNAPNVVGMNIYRGVKTDNQNFPAALKYPIGKHYQFTPPEDGASCIDPLSISAVATCSSGSDGMITITATGGLPKSNSAADKRYFYSKDGGKTFRQGTLAAVGTTYQDTFRNLAPGTYRIAVMDNQIFTISESGSLKTQSFIIQTIVVPDASVTATPTPPSCNAGSNGSIAVSWNAISPTLGYKVEFQKTGGALQSSDETTTAKSFTGLSAGTYSVTVTFKDLGCSTIKTVTLTDPSVLDLVQSTTQPTCPANATTGTKTGSFTVTASGGTSPYTFSLPSGLTASSSTATARTFTNLTAGTYVITVTDNNSCQTTESVTISNPTDYVINLGSTIPPTCNGSSDGSTMFNVTGGAAASFNSIAFGSAGFTTQTFTSITKGATVNPINLSSGNYNVSVTEGTCTYNVSAVVSVSQPTNVTFTSGTPTSPTCNGGSNGQIAIVVSGGTPPYMYSIDNGMNYQTGATFTGLTSGNYTLKAKDSNGCLAVTSPTVSVANGIQVTIFSLAKNNADCKGTSTGDIFIKPDKGTRPFSYSSDNGATFQVDSFFKNIPAGIYPLKIKDANGCLSTTTNLTIDEPANLVTFNTSNTDINCASTTASITVTASGGTGVFQFSSNNGATFTNSSSTPNPYTFTSLTAGTYKIKVRDANGCTAGPTDVPISSTAGPSITLNSKTDVLCNGGQTGVFNITVSGGASPYSVVVKNASNTTIAGTGSNPYDYTGLPAGTYTVSVTDGLSCVSTQNVMISEGNALNPTATATDVTCNGGNDGQISINRGTNGTSPFQFSKDNGMNYSTATATNPFVFNGLTAATYSLKIRDFNGCEASLSKMVGQPTPLSISMTSKTDATCNGGTNGTITVTASGGTGQLSFSKDNGMTYTQQTSPYTFTSLAAATYQIKVKDANNCETSATSVMVGQPSAFSVMTSKVDVLCNGLSTGSITVTASGGTGALEFSKNNGTNYTAGTSPFTFSSLAAATYAIKIKDASGCESAASSVMILEPTPLSISGTSKTDVTCNGGTNGTITVTASGGTGLLSFSKDNGMTYSQQTSPYTFTSLAFGTYQIKVKDANNCETSATSVMVGQPSAIAYNEVSKTNATCGSSNGAIAFNITGGGANYSSVVLKLGATTIRNFGAAISGQGLSTSGLAAGTYAIDVQTTTGCTASFGFTISGQSNIVINSITPTNATCNGGTGQLVVNAMGGVPTLSYSKDGVNFQTSATFTALTAATYTITVKDGAGCTTAQSAMVGEPTAFSVMTSKVDVLCNGLSTGSITVTASGGTGALQFSKNNGTNYTAGTSPFTFNSLAAATYSIKIKDANGCESTVSSVMVSEPTPLSISSTSATITTCNADADGTLTITATGGTSAYEFSKDDGMTYVAGANPYTFTGLTGGNYTVKVRDANGCISASATRNVPKPTVVTVDLVRKVNIKCKGDATGEIEVSADGGRIPSDDYKIKTTDPANPLTIITLPTFGRTFTGLKAGNYTITVTDDFGCFATLNVNLSEPTNPLSIGTVNTTPATCATGGTVSTSASGGTSPYTYALTSSLSNMTGSFTNVSGGNYTLTVTDANDCVSTTSVSVGNSAAPKITVTSQTNILCNGGTTGAFTFGVSGGTGSYTVVVKDASNNTVSTTGSNPYSTSSLAAGTYSISVTDGVSCSASQNVMLTQPMTPLSILVNSQTNVLCNGASTGAVTLVANGGNSMSYTYKKDALTSNATGIFTGLAMGTYVFTVTDANNCTETKSVSISEPSVLTASISGTTTVCQGAILAPNITFTGGGGVAPYTFTYKINGGADQTVTTVMGNAQMLAQSTGAANTFAYTLVKIKDANNCEINVSGSATITVLAPPTAATGCTKRLCPTTPSSTTAVFDLTTLESCVTGGAMGVNVTWFSDAALTMPIATPSSFTSGSTAVYAKIALNGSPACYSVASPTLFVNPVITVSTAKSDVTTNGGNNGSILVTGGGGSGMGALQFSKDGGMTYFPDVTGQYDFTGLAAATYQIRVKDAFGCESANYPVQINQPAAIAFTATPTDAACNGAASGSISVNVTSGVPPFQFSKDDGMTFTAGANPFVFNGLAAASYKIKVKDNTAAITNATTVPVNQPTALSFGIPSITDVKCNGGNDGQIIVAATGGFGAISYGISPNIGTQSPVGTFKNLTAQGYVITATDGNGCTKTINSMVNQPTALSFGIPSVTDVKCNGGNDGQIIVTATGGFGAISYGISPNIGTQSPVGTFKNLTAQGYTITATDGNGCTKNINSTVNQPTALNISVGSKQDKDCTHPTGSVTLSVGGGTGSLQVSLDGVNFQNGLTFNNLAATNYTATVKDASNCTKTFGFSIADNGTLPPSPNAIANRSICGGEMTTLTPSVTGVTTFKFYDSDPTNGGVTPLSTGAFYTHTVSATKTFWITSVNSLCESAPIQTTVTKFDCAKIGDPCLCKNNATTLTNGQFDETVEVSAPAGQTWTVTSVTNLYSMSSAAPPAAPTLISIGATMTYNVGLARYLLNGIHIDGVGYSVTVSNGMGTSLSIGNQCWYPNPSITAPLSISACSSDPSIILAGSAQLGNGGAATGVGSFTVDAIAATSINPAMIGIGNHTITYSFDAADNVPTAAHPGCIQSVSQNILINQTPSVSSIIPTAPLCPGGSDGRIDLTVTGGTAVKTFNWNKTGGGFSASTEDITGLQSGTYNVTITNTTSNTCSTTASAVVPNGVDNTPPMVTCPANQVYNLPSRACSTAVAFNVTATDNCSTPVIPMPTTGIVSGDVLKYGTYNVIYKATDASNNMSTCNFSIQINQFVPQGGLVCYGDVNLTASPTCFTRVKPEMLLSSEAGCLDNYRVEVYTLGGTVLATPVLDASHIGKRFKVAVIDPSGNICWGYLNYEDKTAPEIICPSTASISCGDVGPNGAPLSSLTGEPNVFLECSLPTTTTYNDQYFDVPCGVTLTAAPVGFPAGVPFDVNGAANAKRIIVRTFTVKDRFNNFSTCRQVIYVNRLKTFTTICPPPVTVVCVQNTLRTAPTDTTINGVLVQGTGVPTFSNGLPISSNFLCNAAASFVDVQSGNTIVRSWAVATICGDMTMCTQRITVNPTGATCTTARPTIAGSIRRLNGDNVPTTVVLSSNGDSLSSQTDAIFSFNSLIANRNYTVTPRRANTDWIKGVTTFDVALVSRHVLGITPFSSPYTIIAADVDHDGDISGVDMLLMQQLILRRREALPNNNSWRFVSKNYTFLDPTNPLAEPFAETANFTNLTTNANADFVAIKTGDVNQSATMLRDGSTGQVEVRGARQPFVLPVDDIVLEKNKTYIVPIRLPNDGKTGPSVSSDKNGIQALQFTLSIDKNAADITALSNGNAPDFNDNNLGFFKKEGIVTAAWFRKDKQTAANTDTLTLFNLTIKANQTARLSEIMALNAAYTEGVAYDASGEGMPVQLSFNRQKQAVAKAFLLPNRPNPFNSETVLAFNLPEAGVAKLTVCDLLGKVIMTAERTFEKGINEVIFNANHTPSVSAGIFVVRLQTASGVAEQKIVLSR
jgi:uncharacterized protein (DUF2141 family)